jgi:hypothetical protein
VVYDELYGEYRRLHDLLGRGPDTVPKRLKAIAQASMRTAGTATVTRLHGPQSHSHAIGTNP